MRPVITTGAVLALLAGACGDDGGGNPGGNHDSGPHHDGAPRVGPMLGGCPLLPADHVFNTPIDALPVHPQSDAYITTIGATRRIHLDLGMQTDQQHPEFYGIPYNLVHGDSFTWPQVAFYSPDPGLDWDPRPESDCANASRGVVTPCEGVTPYLPIPQNVIVEGGINTAVDQMPYGDHHILVLDQDTCRLWEVFHAYGKSGGGWDIFGAATFDLRSNALRPETWTSADAAGFPILPLLLRAEEASTGEIKHALRFTILTSKIRSEYVWPARHKTGQLTSQNLPRMGQLFRLKASFQIPASSGTQTRAILQALKTYGMYIADGGSDMYITGDPSALWTDQTLTQVQAVDASNFEAVDMSAITSRPGFDASSGRVP